MLRRLIFAILLMLIAPIARAQPPVFDAHVHLHEGEASFLEYEAKLKETGREAAGVGAMWFGGRNQALQGKPDEIEAGNDGVMALAAKYKKVLPIATVHPYDGKAAIRELERVAGRGVKVLKIHPHTQRFDLDDPRVLMLAKKAGELGVVVLIDNANILPGDSQKLFNLALAAQDTTFVFAHMGGLDFRFWNILAAARTADGLFGDNINFDISATVAIVGGSPIEDEFVWTMRNVGIDHLLFGSDYPQYSVEQNASALEALGLDEAEMAKIRFENAQRLFGLADPGP